MPPKTSTWPALKPSKMKGYQNKGKDHKKRVDFFIREIGDIGLLLTTEMIKNWCQILNSELNVF